MNIESRLRLVLRSAEHIYECSKCNCLLFQRCEIRVTLPKAYLPSGPGSCCLSVLRSKIRPCRASRSQPAIQNIPDRPKTTQRSCCNYVSGRRLVSARYRTIESYLFSTVLVSALTRPSPFRAREQNVQRSQFDVIGYPPIF